MKASLLILICLLVPTLCTPDCYNLTEGVTHKWNNTFLPPSLKGYRVDWMTLKPGKNCAFYTFYDVYFASLSSNLQGIYLNFLNTTVNSGGDSIIGS